MHTIALSRAVLLAALAVLSGCAALGDNEFACPGMPSDPLCQSATEVYEATHATDRVTRPAAPAEGDQPVAPNPRPTAAPRLRRAAYPTPEGPVPIRTPARVMRIWIAPWEDGDGDLIVSGYVYTEIEPRRWLIGLPDRQDEDLRITPLQVMRAAPGQDRNTHREPPRLREDMRETAGNQP